MTDNKTTKYMISLYYNDLEKYKELKKEKKTKKLSKKEIEKQHIEEENKKIVQYLMSLNYYCQ